MADFGLIENTFTSVPPWVCAGSLGDPATWGPESSELFSDLHFKVKERVP